MLKFLLLASIVRLTLALECYFQTDMKRKSMSLIIIPYIGFWSWIDQHSSRLSRRICGSNMTNCMKLEQYPRKIYLGCADDQACSVCLFFVLEDQRIHSRKARRVLHASTRPVLNRVAARDIFARSRSYRVLVFRLSKLLLSPLSHSSCAHSLTKANHSYYNVFSFSLC